VTKEPITKVKTNYYLTVFSTALLREEEKQELGIKTEEEDGSAVEDGVDIFPEIKRQKIEINSSVAPATGSVIIEVSDLLEPLPVPHIHHID
jgi:hypothetical protein